MTDALAPLRARFRARTASDLERLRAGADAAETQGIVHNLAGAAGIFGYADLSAAAAVVDDALVAGHAPDAASMDRLYQEIELACAGGDASSGAIR